MNGQAHPIEIYVNTIKGEELQEIIRKSLPRAVSDVKFTAAVIAAVKSNPDFVKCERQSVYNSIIEAARKGLVPDGKQGALVPFYDNRARVLKCQFMIMPEGIVDSLAKIGITIYAQSVYKNDKYKFWSDSRGQHVEHEFDPFSERGPRVGAFACATTEDGISYVEAMNMDDIKRVMACSKSRDKDTGEMKGPWKDWRERMEQKSCMHRVCKRTPNVEIGEDDEYKDEVVSVVPPPEQTAGNEPEAGEAPTPTHTTAAGPSRPKSLQRLIDEETGAVLSSDEVLEPEPEPASVDYNPNGSPF